MTRNAVTIIGIAGGSGSGKTTFSRQIAAALGSKHVVALSHDDYYHDLGHLNERQRARQNFDDPGALDSELLAQHLDRLSRGESVEVPQYDFASHTRRSSTRVVHPRAIVLIEGVLLFAHEAIRKACHLRVFIDADEATRFHRRKQRDCEHRGRAVESVERQWHESVKPMYDRHVAPSRRHAHVIVPAHHPNEVAVEVIVRFLASSVNTDDGPANDFTLSPGGSSVARRGSD